MKGQTWVVVADASRARFICIHSLKDVQELDPLIHSASRLASHELVTDRPGLAFERTTNATRRYSEEKKSPKKNEAEHFAKQVAQHLETARQNNQLTKLYLSSSPEFLGMLRNHFPKQLKDIVRDEVNKDLTHQRVDEICEHFTLVV